MLRRNPVETEQGRKEKEELIFGLRVKNGMNVRNWRLIFRSNRMNLLIFNHLWLPQQQHVWFRLLGRNTVFHWSRSGQRLTRHNCRPGKEGS